MEMNKNTKKNDLILIAVLAGTALSALLGMSLFFGAGSKGGKAVVFIDGKESASYSLNEELTVPVETENGGYNLLEIKDGKANIKEASCPDKICVNHHPVNKNGQTLVCLPNKVVVEIVSGEEPDVDGFTR